MQILSYKKYGYGNKNIIFLHELMGDSSNYKSCIEYFDKNLFSCYLVDLRGYGDSKNIAGNYNLQESIEDVINLVSFLNLNEYILLAHSMSTMIAQHVALRDKRLSKLILVTPISFLGVKSTNKAKENLLEQMKKNSGKIEEIVEQSSQRYNLTWKNYRINLAYNSSLLEARISYMSMYLNTDFNLENIKDFKIDIPIKIIVGKFDFPIFSKVEVEKYFKIFDDVEISECLEAGHYPMIECPVYFASKIESWCN